MPNPSIIARDAELAAEKYAREHEAEIELEIARRQEQFQGSLKPTNKWIAALVGGLALIALHTLVSGGFDTTEFGELAALASAVVPAYFARNHSTPTGVPPKN